MALSLALLVACCASAISAHSEPPRIHDLYVEEELPAGTIVGNLLREGALLYTPMPPDVIDLLRFSVLNEPSPERRLFEVEERTGVVRTVERIDRERVCASKDEVCESGEWACLRGGDAECAVLLDVVVKPLQHFRVIKVKVSALYSVFRSSRSVHSVALQGH